MNKITPQQVEEIRKSVDIVSVISSYISLTPKGKNYFGVCPFHDDHSPSMSVSKERQIYTCFSCGATGTVINFVMDFEHISFLETLKKLADLGGVSIDIHASQPKKESDLYEMYRLSHKLYQNNINTVQGKKAKEYLMNRNIDESLIKEFGIGLAFKNSDLLTKLLVQKKFSEKNIINSGLVAKTKNGYADIFYHRIMFPLHNLAGQVVGYSGRIYESQDSAKYINTKETEIFKKGEILYNYHRARDFCRQSGTVIIMEGFMDVIRAYSVGVQNVIATMGTAVTKYQANLIRRLANQVILCFDGDTAGAKATFTCGKELQTMDIYPKVVRLEENLDPDEYILKYGKEKFLSKLEYPMTMVDFELQYLKEGKDFTNTTDVSNYVNAVIEQLSTTHDDVLRELTLKKVSEETSLELEFLKKQLAQKKPIQKSSDIKVIPKKITHYTKYQKAEQGLLYYMLRYKEVIKMYDAQMTFMPTKRYRKLATEISCYYRKMHEIEIASFMTYLEQNEQLRHTIGEIERPDIHEESSMEEIRQYVEDYIAVIREYNINQECNRIEKQIKQETDPIKQSVLLTQMMSLKHSNEGV